MKSIVCLIAFSTTLLSACTGIVAQASDNAPLQSTPPEIHVLWQLKSAPKSFRLPEKAELDLREPQTAGAFMGCNNMRFAVQIAPDSGSLKADTIMSTRMYCAEFAQLESSFAQLLRDGAQIVWQKGQLVLVDKNGATWLFQQTNH